LSESDAVPSSSGEIAAAVAERIRRPVPSGLSVLVGSLPVVSFGDPNRAAAATLSLNPSWREFESRGGVWLYGSDRRLASLTSLGVDDARDLDDDQVATVVAECNAYFRGPNWYRGWFHWLESILRGSEAGSYFDGSACHLDLVQWATKPAQGELPAEVWNRLVDQDRDFLRWQLANSNVRVLLLNGASVVRWFQEAGLAPSFEERVLTYRGANGSSRLRVFQAIAEGVLVLGWNRPLAGALSADGRLRLSAWLGEALHRPGSDADYIKRVTTMREEGTMSAAIELVNGFVPEGVVVNGVLELQRVLAHWVEASQQPTVGDVGTFGGSPVITVRMRADEFVLNRDTKRAAVHAFLAAGARAGGADRLRWHVTTNARGNVNRVTYRPDDEATPGWYAYVRGVSEPRDLE
jgi:hypothetical protein